MPHNKKKGGKQTKNAQIESSLSIKDDNLDLINNEDMQRQQMTNEDVPEMEPDNSVSSSLS